MRCVTNGGTGRIVCTGVYWGVVADVVEVADTVTDAAGVTTGGWDTWVEGMEVVVTVAEK